MSADDPAGGERRAELAGSLAAVEARVAAACAAAGRPRGAVQVIAVTKFFPASDVRHLLDLGVRHVGENRDQEARAKLAGLAGTDPEGLDAPTVHMVGQVQTNKAASVAQWADVVHAVDRPRLVTALDRAAAAQGGPLDVLVQLDLRADASGDGGPGARAGVTPADLPALVDAVVGAEALRLRGLMAVAPIGAGEGPPEEAFARLADLAAQVRRTAPEATWLSAGMSGDLEAAVHAGATHLRVGSAILGPRPSPR